MLQLITLLLQYLRVGFIVGIPSLSQIVGDNVQVHRSQYR